MELKHDFSPREFCSRAIAYVKAALPDAPDAPPPIQLSHEDSPILRPICEGLVTAYIVDAGGVFKYVQNRDIDAAGITLAELHRTGVINLAETTRNRLEIQSYSKIYAFLAGGNFESSCILLDDLFDRVLSTHISNGYVAALPARDILAVCSRDSMDGIRELEQLIERIWPGGDHLISNRLYFRDESGWHPLELPETI